MNKSHILLLLVLALLCLTACGLALRQAQEPNQENAQGQIAVLPLEDRETTISDALTFSHSMPLSYAKRFAVDYYEGGFTLLTSADRSRLLVIPEDSVVPEDLPEDVKTVRRPVANLYLAGSAAMDFFASLDALDTISFCSLTADGWYVEEAREAMEEGRLQYAGKYSAPDYEMIAASHCPLAIENTMITHAPEVIEKLEDFGVQVLMDYASYEEDPLGRMEWVKFYGALLGCEEEAEHVFTERTDFSALKEIADPPTVAFFYLSSNGLVTVRRSTDYVPKMIAMAGGRYVPEDTGSEDSNRATIAMQTEQFYADCKDADILIYNATIAGELKSVDDLIVMDEMFASFRAVQEHRVYCTRFSLYQQTMRLSRTIRELNAVFGGKEEQSFETIYRLE